MTFSESVPYFLWHTDAGDRRMSLTDSTHWTFGRDNDNHFVIAYPWISRSHAMVQITQAGEVYLFDLGSRNGTFVNNRRVITPVTLQDADIVVLGQTELEFHNPLSQQLSDREVRAASINSDPQITSYLRVRRLMSVLVVDIRDFTILSRQLDDEILSALIGQWCREAGTIVREHNSGADKYIGDALMAIWFHGQKTVGAEELITIFQAIQKIYQMTATLNQQFSLPFPVRVGIGLNTGKAMVGNTGSGQYPEYTAIGDAVNTAFRLESATKEIGHDIAVGKVTYRYLESMGLTNIDYQRVLVELKGYEEPVVAYGTNFAEIDNLLAADPLSAQQNQTLPDV